jgi:hypothetical protein
MSEHHFVRSVHRRLPVTVYRWKVADRYTNGIPDAWYSGALGDVWVEYKYLPRTPRSAFEVPLTPLQLKWLSEREAEGRNVAVIVGCPKGAAILSAKDCTKKVEVNNWIPIAEVANWITKKTVR